MPYSYDIDSGRKSSSPPKSSRPPGAPKPPKPPRPPKPPGKRGPFLKILLVAAAIVLIVAAGLIANSRLHLTDKIRSLAGADDTATEAQSGDGQEEADGSGASSDGSKADSEDNAEADSATAGGEEDITDADGEGESDSSVSKETVTFSYSITDGSTGSSSVGYTQDEDAAEIWEKTVSAAAAVTDASPLPGLDDSADGTLEMNLLYLYDPDGAFLLNYTEKTGYDYLDYFSGNDALTSVSTAVHEECHVFMRSNLGWNVLSVYVGDGYSIGVEYTDTFDSQEMTDMIPEELRTFRFDTYVGDPEENLSSNVEGIYGLLNEFTAYCWDNHTSSCLFEYYATLEPTKDTWFAWLGQSNTIGAYAEFRYYMLTYLLYARENEPDVYDGIMENDSFLLAFQAVDSRFREVVAEYETHLDQACEILEDAGYDAGWDRTSYQFTAGKSGTIYYLTLSGLEDYDLLMDFMGSDADYIAMYELLWDMG